MSGRHWVLGASHCLTLAYAFMLAGTIQYSESPLFLAIFVSRYFRLAVSIFSFFVLYKPAEIRGKPTFGRQDVTVIIPTAAPPGPEFLECVASVLQQRPRAVMIVGVGKAMVDLIQTSVAKLHDKFPGTDIEIHCTDVANKRLQLTHAIVLVQTPITVFADDHVFWPSKNFLPSVLAGFEDPNVAVVGTNKRVRRDTPGVWGVQSFANLIGCIYLTRHNFEIRASNAIPGDKSVFVVSGRTSAHRTCLLKNKKLLKGFINERFLFGLLGPLNADDDNYLTRWYVANGWDVKIQYTEDSIVETTLGTYPKIQAQLLRWARTTWRSNPALLRSSMRVWCEQPWAVITIYLGLLQNFAVIWDSALIWSYLHSSWHTSFGAYGLVVLVMLILATKLVKPFAHFVSHPTDIPLIPVSWAFSYVHSFIKFWALVTFWDISWGGRDLS